MDNHLTQQQDALIEDALKSLPLEPMPGDITALVMARIQKGTRPTLMTWNDLVISLVVVICTAALYFASNNLPPIVIMEMRKHAILFYQFLLVNAGWLMPASLLALAAILSALTIPFLGRQLKT